MGLLTILYIQTLVPWKRGGLPVLIMLWQVGALVFTSCLNVRRYFSVCDEPIKIANEY